MIRQDKLTTLELMLDLAQLEIQLPQESEKNQLQLISKLETLGSSGLEVLSKFLLLQKNTPPTPPLGKAYQVLYQAKTPETMAFLEEHFPTGVVPIDSADDIDYLPLQRFLAEQKYQEADTLTRVKMCELAGEGAIRRKWVYFTEVSRFPIIDLKTLNSLWVNYSEGKFGFSVQRSLWVSVGRDYNKLWPKIGWKNNNNWTKYPHEFTWNISAPIGHLPLLNQLRGVRVTDSLFSHPVWNQ